VGRQRDGEAWLTDDPLKAETSQGEEGKGGKGFKKMLQMRVK
jgi:hypothetical protein